MQVTGLVLAGGASRRMGRDKLQLPVSPQAELTIIEHVVLTMLAVASDTSVAVAPHQEFAMNQLLSPLRAGKTMPNRNPVGGKQVYADTSPVGPAGRIRIIADMKPYEGPLAGLARAWPLAVDGKWMPVDTGRSPESDCVLVAAGDYPGLQSEVLRVCAERAKQAFSTPANGVIVDGVTVRRKGILQPLLGCYRMSAGRMFHAAVQAGERRLMRTVEKLNLATVDAEEYEWPEWWTRPVHTPEDYTEWLKSDE